MGWGLPRDLTLDSLSTIVEINRPYEDAFLFVGEDGEEIYIKRTCPFFEDESRDVFEEITKQEFETFC